MTQYATWTGASGRQYEFQIDGIGSQYRSVPGIYMFVRSQNERWYSLYVGQTNDFNYRINTALKSHNAWQCVSLRGASHLATLVTSGTERERIALETDLRHGLNPPCNQQ